jgi:hypothetical protein
MVRYSKGVIEVGAAVAVEEGAGAVRGRLPLGLADHEGGAGELGDRRSVFEMHAGHHHDRDLARLEVALAQLGGDVFAGGEGRLAGACRERAEVRPRVCRNRGVQAGVDEDRPGAGSIRKVRTFERRVFAHVL